MTAPRRNGLFAKLMMLTTSTNDAEALAALRKANAILKGARVSWAELLDAISRDDAAPAAAAHDEPDDPAEGKRYDDADEINGMFASLFERNISNGFAEFIEGTHIFWKRRGFDGKAVFGNQACGREELGMKEPKRAESDMDAELRRRLRVEVGRATRKPATGRISNSMVRKPRKPSMPQMPWDDAQAQ